MGSIVHQPVHPRAFESDIADAQICLTFTQRYQLLRGGVVSLGAAAFGHHAAYGELISGNGFGEVPLRFHRDGDDPLSRIAFPVAGTGGKEQEEKEENSLSSYSSPGDMGYY